MEEIKNLISTFFETFKRKGLKIDSEKMYVVSMSVCSIDANLDFEVNSRTKEDILKELEGYLYYINNK